MHILSFRPELIIYFYMANCLAVLIFNIIYIFADRFKGKRLGSRSLKMADMLKEQIAHLDACGDVEQAHLDRLAVFLKKLENMRAFERSVDELLGENSDPERRELVTRYLRSLRPVFLKLADCYERRDEIEQAYFASLIEKFGIDRGHVALDGIMEFLNRLVVKRDVYVRENALKALYSIGNQEAVLAAWEKMEATRVYHNQKLLADGLLKFTGDRTALAWFLWKRREEFDVLLLLPVMQFIRFLTDEFQEEFLKLLHSETADKELRLEAIRYFRKYPYEAAREALKQFVRYQEYIDWEYAAMAAIALSAYPGADTVDCLKGGLGASNWYVRLNCAESLVKGMKLPKWELYDVYNGNDRYAREILDYVAEKSEIRGQEMELK